MTIQELIDEAYTNACAHGWHDTPRPFPETIALIHSEVSEALEAYRDGFNLVEDMVTDAGKPIGIPSELADIMIRVADAAGEYGIDLEAAIARKLAYNQTRPYRHGNKLA